MEFDLNGLIKKKTWKEIIDIILTAVMLVITIGYSIGLLPNLTSHSVLLGSSTIAHALHWITGLAVYWLPGTLLFSARFLALDIEESVPSHTIQSTNSEAIKNGYSPESGIVTTYLSFRDVLHTKLRIGHISKITEIAEELGYPYFIWNDRVYHLVDGKGVDTGLTSSSVI